MTTLWIRYRTIGGAILATVVLGGLVYAGRLQSTRALVPLVFAWMFALHSMDYRDATERHATAVLQALAHAGIEERRGHRTEALRDVATAIHETADALDEVAVQRKNKGAS